MCEKILKNNNTYTKLLFSTFKTKLACIKHLQNLNKHLQNALIVNKTKENHNLNEKKPPFCFARHCILCICAGLYTFCVCSRLSTRLWGFVKNWEKLRIFPSILTTKSYKNVDWWNIELGFIWNHWSMQKSNCVGGKFFQGYDTVVIFVRLQWQIYKDKNFQMSELENQILESYRNKFFIDKLCV